MVCNCGFWSLSWKIGLSVRFGMTEGWVELHSSQGIIFKIFFLLGTNQATEFNEPLEPFLSIHAEEEDQVFVYLYNEKFSI